MTPLLMDSWHTAGSVVVNVAGEIDATNAGRLQEYLTAAGRSGLPLVLDFASVTFMDSMGLLILARLDEELRARGSRLLLAAVQGPAARILTITGVDEVLDLHPDVRHALTELGEQAPFPERDSA